MTRMSLVLDGKSVAQEVEADLKFRMEALMKTLGDEPPILATILVGDDPASATYVRMKGNACRRVGMESQNIILPQTATTEELLGVIDDLNNRPRVHGILLQHPTPSQINE